MSDTIFHQKRPRAPPRTYARKTANNAPAPTAPPSAKRRRLSSSPPPAPSSSLPPSPVVPPRPASTPADATLTSSSPPPIRSRTPFTLTRTPRSTASSSNIRPRPGNARKTPATKPLTQMTLDLGQSLRRTCRDCGMSYHPSTPSDASLHASFHAKILGGIDFPYTCHKLWEMGEKFIVCVDRRSAVGERRKVREVLDVMDVELGAGEIADDVLWGARGDRWRVYLYVSGKKVQGCLVAERIRRGWRAVGGDGALGKGEAVEGVVMGVARVWVGNGVRRTGVARRLLEIARSNFVYGMELGWMMVAFSQPTEAGKRFAAGVVGAEGDGWLVYDEGDVDHGHQGEDRMVSAKPPPESAEVTVTRPPKDTQEEGSRDKKATQVAMDGQRRALIEQKDDTPDNTEEQLDKTNPSDRKEK